METFILSNIASFTFDLLTRWVNVFIFRRKVRDILGRIGNVVDGCGGDGSKWNLQVKAGILSNTGEEGMIAQVEPMMKAEVVGNKKQLSKSKVDLDIEDIDDNLPSVQQDLTQEQRKQHQEQNEHQQQQLKSTLHENEITLKERTPMSISHTTIDEELESTIEISSKKRMDSLAATITSKSYRSRPSRSNTGNENINGTRRPTIQSSKTQRTNYSSSTTTTSRTRSISVQNQYSRPLFNQGRRRSGSLDILDTKRQSSSRKQSNSLLGSQSGSNLPQLQPHFMGSSSTDLLEKANSNHFGGPSAVRSIMFSVTSEDLNGYNFNKDSLDRMSGIPASRSIMFSVTSADQINDENDNLGDGGNGRGGLEDVVNGGDGAVTENNPGMTGTGITVPIGGPRQQRQPSIFSVESLEAHGLIDTVPRKSFFRNSVTGSCNNNDNNSNKNNHSHDSDLDSISLGGTITTTTPFISAANQNHNRRQRDMNIIPLGTHSRRESVLTLEKIERMSISSSSAILKNPTESDVNRLRMLDRALGSGLYQTGGVTMGGVSGVFAGVNNGGKKSSRGGPPSAGSHHIPKRPSVSGGSSVHTGGTDRNSILDEREEHMMGSLSLLAPSEKSNSEEQSTTLPAVLMPSISPVTPQPSHSLFPLSELEAEPSSTPAVLNLQEQQQQQSQEKEPPQNPTSNTLTMEKTMSLSASFHTFESSLTPSSMTSSPISSTTSQDQNPTAPTPRDEVYSLCNIFVIKALAIQQAEWTSRMYSITLLFAFVSYLNVTECYGRPSATVATVKTITMILIGFVFDLVGTMLERRSVRMVSERLFGGFVDLKRKKRKKKGGFWDKKWDMVKGWVNDGGSHDKKAFDGDTVVDIDDGEDEGEEPIGMEDEDQYKDFWIEGLETFQIIPFGFRGYMFMCVSVLSLVGPFLAVEAGIVGFESPCFA
ncbi:hypothetical protein HDU76_005001 [Blyttiomyces sp. JEL0837]|nr:hypothetical protein HDU76_005001 [Blyttiomyces sp. JEL0837]